MAISDIIVLPAAEAAFVPLAGDGLTAPFAMYCTFQSLVGDASGGLAQLIISLDSRYCSMVQICAWVVTQATPGDMEFAIAISAAPNQSSTAIGYQGTSESIVLGGALTENIRGYWSPPAVILGPSDGSNPAIGLNFDNVLADVYTLRTQILLWDINVRQRTPWQILANSLTGSGSTSHSLG